MLKITLSKTELNSFGKYCARSERERRGRWLTEGTPFIAVFRAVCPPAALAGCQPAPRDRDAKNEKLKKSLEEAVTIESGEQALARATIREIPDKDIHKARMHRREKKKAA